MNRSDLEKRVIQELEEEGYICERAYNKSVYIPGKGYVGKRFDFFHVIDIIAIRGSEVRWIQVTSQNANPNSRQHSRNGSHAVTDHKKKIEEYWPFDLPLELWEYEKVRNRWTLAIEVYHGKKWEKDIICAMLKEDDEL